MTDEQITRFWSNIHKPSNDPGCCWIWTGRKRSGYGVFKSQANFYAHRFSFELHKGPVPANLLVCHHCDNRECTNPNHLFCGTEADNSRDAVLKNKKCPTYSNMIIAEVRLDRSLGLTERAIAAKYGMAHSYVHKIVSGKTLR